MTGGPEKIAEQVGSNALWAGLTEEEMGYAVRMLPVFNPTDSDSLVAGAMTLDVEDLGSLADKPEVLAFDLSDSDMVARAILMVVEKDVPAKKLVLTGVR